MSPNFIKTNYLAAGTLVTCLACSASNVLAMHSNLPGLTSPDHCQFIEFLLHSPTTQVAADLAENAIVSFGEVKISSILHCLSGMGPDSALWLLSNLAHVFHTVLSQLYC